ncbi:hypothetical protein [Arcticibacter sp. MXS-1]|uniref:hypothetical protein n=1 Tax=Arcticibacter sp. MXS-1 TaxID=3341726 RepID=UPI0035A9885C
MDKKILLISTLSGLYLALLLSGEVNRLTSFIATGVVVELLTIPAVILQLSLFVYAMYNLHSKRFKFTVTSVTPVAVFLVLFIWAAVRK